MLKHNSEIAVSGLCSPVYSPEPDRRYDNDYLRASRKTASINKLDFIWIEITPKCNLDCIHCYADSNANNPLNLGMNLTNWKDILFQSSELGCKQIQFIGGEPTMHPDLRTLIGHARKLSFDIVEVSTNGTLFTDSVKETFLYHRVALAFSIYAAHANVHDLITQQVGSFSKTIDSIQWALKSGLAIRVSIIGMNANSKNVIQAWKMLKKIGVPSISIDYVRRMGRGLNAMAAHPAIQEACAQCYKNKLCISADGHVFACIFSRNYQIGHSRQGLNNILSLLTHRMA